MSTATSTTDIRSNKKRPGTAEAPTAPKFRVILKRHPRGYDACSETTTIGEYSTLAQARKVAMTERDNHCKFDYWREVHYEVVDKDKKELCSYHTADCPDPTGLADEDEYT